MPDRRDPPPPTEVRRVRPRVDYRLGPATRLFWRSPEAVQLELGGREVVVEGLPAAALRRLATRAPQGAAPRLDRATRSALRRLADAGYLWTRSPDEDDPRLAPPEPRLAGELAALAVQHGERAAELLSARRHSAVRICGSGRIAVQLGALLAAAGVGRVHCAVQGAARLWQAMPGGTRPADEGGLAVSAAAAAIRRAAPSCDPSPLPDGTPPELVVLCLDAPAADERIASLHADGAPYLAVHLDVGHGVVGPLVLPGLTACLRCLDRHRRDRDPAWSALAAQQGIPRRYGPANAVAVAAIVAGYAAEQALTFLDGGEPSCLDATLELRPPDWRVRRRSWPPHPDCGCGR